MHTVLTTSQVARARRARTTALDEMVRVSEEAGLYDLPDDIPFERLPVEDSRTAEQFPAFFDTVY